MNTAQHTETIPLRVPCVKPGRAWLVRLCAAAIALAAAVAVPAAAWAYYISNEDLNDLPLAPRLLAAGAVCLAAWALFQCLEERTVPLRLDLDRSALTLTWERLPSVWREGELRRTVRIPCASVSLCRLSGRRQRLLVRSRGYFRRDGGEKEQKRAGVVEFSTLDAGNVDFPALLRQYCGIEVSVED